MNILQINFAEIPAAVQTVTGFIKENPLLCGIMLISYALYYIYSFIHNKSVDSDIYEIDMVSAAISSIMVSMLLIGLDESSKGFNLMAMDLSSQTTKIAIFLLSYAVILLFFGFTKILPKFLVVLLGNSELDLFINFGAALLTDPDVAITGTLLLVMGAPLAILLVIQRIRRLMG